MHTPTNSVARAPKVIRFLDVAEWNFSLLNWVFNDIYYYAQFIFFAISVQMIEMYQE